jgi:three-Cys-motif partner protein
MPERLVAAMPMKKFFAERTDQSEVKARIVEKYFYAWANVIMPSASLTGGKIAYIDLYAGPGRYKDGAASTPLLVLERAIAHPKMSQMLVAFLNDADKNLSDTLQNEINKLPGVENLKFKPEVWCGEVDEDAEKFFKETRLVPTFTFIDPFGYKGLSLGIVRGVIKDWGCDCVFFFNYNRINAGLANAAIRQHIDALFGNDRSERLRVAVQGKTPDVREALILEQLAQAIKSMGGRFVLPFIFKNETGGRTSHSLVFVSKHIKGYEIMKEIMAQESSVADQGVPSFTYSPADASMPTLFPLTTPLDKLEGMLRREFEGQTLTMEQIYLRHSVGRSYIKRNYKAALLSLEQAGRITANPPLKASPPAKGRRAGTFADSVMVTFLACKH